MADERLSGDDDGTPDKGAAGSILIIDDNPGNLRVLAAIIEQAGYHTRATLSGELALRWLSGNAPDLILLDIRMPGMDGFEVCRRVKSDPATRDIPIIFISALHDTGDKVRGFEEGAVDYIAKPFQAGEVIARVNAHVELTRARHALEATNRELEDRVAARTRELEASKSQAEYLAYHDDLTGLANRRLFEDRLSHELQRVRRHGVTGAVLFIDLDHFKTINDALGHAMGDSYLGAVANAMKVALRDVDTLSRWGGDEFVVLLPDLGGSPDEAGLSAGMVAKKLATVIGDPVAVEGTELQAGASIGVALYPADGVEVEQVISRADAAMYAAKQAGRGTVRFFEPRMQAMAQQRFELERDLRQALERDEFLMLYQAQVDGRRQVYGVEALLRWRHPRRGVLVPGDFTAVAEDSGIILPLGAWVMSSAMSQQARWRQQPFWHHRPVVVAINVSPRQFHQADFPAQVESALAETGADPAFIELEIRESMLIGDPDDISRKIKRLKSLGVRFAIDDFGTGYSSLVYLKQLPIDRLKIGRSFVHGLPDDGANASIVRTVIAMARNLGLEVVAEGVETEAEMSFLHAAGCGFCQGYLFGRDEAVERMTERLATGNREHPG